MSNTHTASAAPIKVSITNEGYAAAINNQPNKDGFRIELSKARVLQNGVIKGEWEVRGRRIKEKQIRLQATIKHDTAQFDFDEVHLIDKLSNVVFAKINREDGLAMGYVAPFNQAFLNFDIVFSSLPDDAVTIEQASDDLNFLMGYLERLIETFPKATTNTYGIVQLTDNIIANKERDDLGVTPKGVFDAMTQFEMPIGSVIYYCLPTLPKNGKWLWADGAEISRIDYSEAFDEFGTIYGAGDGLTTFNLPKANDLFFRATGEKTKLGERKKGSIGDHFHGMGYVTDAHNDAMFPIAKGRSWRDGKVYDFRYVRDTYDRPNSNFEWKGYSSDTVAVGGNTGIVTSGVLEQEGDITPDHLGLNVIVKVK